ncbi:MAG: N-acetylmuramoyl-L-alanine amidase [Clostridia bacterium]|nr:N-acetylmuramoyl-L-alanine amidase [Clostridia bacterium]
MKLIKQIIPVSSTVRPGKIYPKYYICIHETDNTSKGANAKAHADLLMRKARENDGYYVSYHFAVDDRCVYQMIPEKENAYHAGDGKGPGNLNSIGIEICVNKDGDFEKALLNTAELVADLYKKFSLWRGDMRQHYDFSSYKKNCPKTIRNSGRWEEFLDMCDRAYDKKYGAGKKKEEEELKALEKCGKLEKKLNDLTNKLNKLSTENDHIRQKLINKQDKIITRENPFEWEKEAVDYCVSQGIIKGDGEKIDLSEPVNMGKMTVVIYRVIMHIKKWFVKKEDFLKYNTK